MNDEALSRLNLPDPRIALLVDVITCTDVDPQIRERAIDHPSISDAVLLAFMQTASEDVFDRCSAATSRIAVLRHYMLDGNVDQRTSVAFNSASAEAAHKPSFPRPHPSIQSSVCFATPKPALGIDGLAPDL